LAKKDFENVYYEQGTPYREKNLTYAHENGFEKCSCHITQVRPEKWHDYCYEP